MSFMTVPNSRCDGVSFLHCDVSFSFVSDMRIKVTSGDVDIIGRRVVLLSQGVNFFLNLTLTRAHLTRAHIHACNVDWTRCQG